jgi:heme-binding NEAT domain protein
VLRWKTEKQIYFVTHNARFFSRPGVTNWAREETASTATQFLSKGMSTIHRTKINLHKHGSDRFSSMN